MFKKRARFKASPPGCNGDCAECFRRGLNELNQRAVNAARDLFSDLLHDYLVDHPVEKGSDQEVEAELEVADAFLRWATIVLEHHGAPTPDAVAQFITCLEDAREASAVDTLGPPEEEEDDLSPPPSIPRTVN